MRSLGSVVWLLMVVLLGTPAMAEDSIALNFAKRLMSPPHPNGLSRDIEFFPNKLPDDMSFDFPVPNGSRLIGSSMHYEGGDRTEVRVIIDVHADVETAFSLFRNALNERGWQLLEDRRRERGGFITGNQFTSAMFCRGEGDTWIRLIYASLPSGVTEARAYVTFGSSISRPAGPCSEEQRDMFRARYEHPLDKLLPRLTMPEGTVQYSGGGGGGSHERDSRATVRIEMSVPTLHEHFAKQLVESGWQDRGGVAEDDLAWSVWDVPSDEGDVNGLLYVVAGPDSQRYLRLEVVMPEFRE